MAHSGTRDGYKRYYLTLNEEKFTAYQAMLKSFGAPREMGSLLIDEYIKGMVDLVYPVIKKAKDSGKDLSFADFLLMVGAIMKDSQDEQLKL